MSLERAYDRLRNNAVLYWLALPTLLFVQLLGCGHRPFDPSKYRLYQDWQRDSQGKLYLKTYPWVD